MGVRINISWLHVTQMAKGTGRHLSRTGIRDLVCMDLATVVVTATKQYLNLATFSLFGNVFGKCNYFFVFVHVLGTLH